MRRLAFAVLLLLAVAARGDTWMGTTEPQTYDSANRSWRLVTTPGTETAPSYAELFRRGDRGTWQRTARWTFVNELYPLQALVANDGTVVTVDARRNDDVVVIYRPDGTLVNRLALSDLLEEEDIFQLSRSTSRTHWGGTHHIVEENRVLLLEINAHRPEELPVSLESGLLLVPKRVLFPRPKVEWKAETAPPCLTTEELTARAVAAPVPEYPIVARKARVSGDVVLELLIGKDGAVEKVTVLKPLPFGIDAAAQKAAGAWRFRPQSAESCAIVRMTFDLTRF